MTKRTFSKTELEQARKYQAHPTPYNGKAYSVGQRFGKLQILDIYRRADVEAPKYRAVCVCDCGELTDVGTNDLRRGKTTSCGCIAKALARKNCKKLGRANAKKVNLGNSQGGIWATYGERIDNWARNVVQRTTNPSHHNYQNYGGRGISIAFDTLHSFVSYCEKLAWAQGFGGIEDALDYGYSIDRIDNDGNYEAGNLRWASESEQMSNRRRDFAADNRCRWGKVMLELGYSQSETARQLGVSQRCVSGWAAGKNMAQVKAPAPLVNALKAVARFLDTVTPEAKPSQSVKRSKPASKGSHPKLALVGEWVR